MPTSITTAPGLTMSAVTNFGWPMATIRMSACRVISARSRVRLWQTVTVASPPAAALHEHDRHRLADDVAAAHDHHVPAGDLDVVAHQQLLNAVRRAGQEPRPALHDAAHVLRMKGIDVLQRVDGVQHARVVDLLRQRQLHQDAVDRLVLGLVQLGDQRQQLVLRGRRPAGGTGGFACRPARRPSPCCARRPRWPGRRRPARPPAWALRRCSR